MADPRVVLITGGTGALGSAVVDRFVADAARVHFTGRSAASDRGGATAHAADVTREADVAALFAAIAAADGGLDVLVNVVGGFRHGLLADTDLAAWRGMLDLNATSAFLCARAAAAPMRARGGGRIVNVSSVAALGRSAAGKSAYAAAKAAVLGLTAALAAELRPDGITVNSILPTVIDTEANRRDMPGADTTRWLPPAEVAAVIAFLASPAARIVTGNAILLEA